MKNFTPLLMALLTLSVSACGQQPTSGMPGGGHDVAAAPQDVSSETATALATPPDVAKRAPSTSDTASAR